MPKKVIKRRDSRNRSRIKKVEKATKTQEVAFEKIDMFVAKEEDLVEKEVSGLLLRFKRIFTDHHNLTRAEFAKYFGIPFLASFILLFLLLLLLNSKDPLRVPSFQVRTSVHGLGDLVSKLNIFTSHKSLKGQEVFDPYEVKLDIDKGEMFYALFDVRSPKEFGKGHIRDALNLPAYTSFSDLKKFSISERDLIGTLRSIMPHKKPILVYGSTRDSQVTHDVAAILRRNGFEVSVLGVGWNEWRHFTNLWVPEAGWDSFDIDRYVDEERY